MLLIIYLLINHSITHSFINKLVSESSSQGIYEIKMEGESSFSMVTPPIFDGDNYQIWAVRMKTYLEALDLREEVKEDYEVPQLPANSTVAQIKA